MSDLLTMKARIAREVRRSNISTDIAAAISTAIEHYQGERFWWNETRTFEFDTVADQDAYDSDDDADLGNIQKIDFVMWITSGIAWPLRAMSAEQITHLNAGSVFTGQPIGYCWFGEQLIIYPIPVSAETIRVGCIKTVAEPASDAETDNPWMVEGEELIRNHSKWILYSQVILNPEAAQLFHPDNDVSPLKLVYDRMKRRTARLAQQGGWTVTPTSF